MTASTSAPEQASASAAVSAARAAGLTEVAPLDKALICEHIRIAVTGVRDVMDVIVTVVEALKHQNAGLDEEFAHVLQAHASNRLYAETEQLKALANVLELPSGGEGPDIEHEPDDEEAAFAA